MKKYTVKDGEDLGFIAKKFWINSWKYLYEINKDVIGDNPDILKPGIKLKIPQWNDTQGDEEIEKKGARAFDYVNGLRYSYVWVPYSRTIINVENRTVDDFEETREFSIISNRHKTVLAKGKIQKNNEIGALIPDAEKTILKIDGLLLF